MEECIQNALQTFALKHFKKPGIRQPLASTCFFKNTKKIARIEMKCFQTEAHSLALRTLKLTNCSLCLYNNHLC